MPTRDAHRPERRRHQADAGSASSTSIAKVPGLALRVTPSGAKSWTVRYRHRGRLRRMTLGERRRHRRWRRRASARVTLLHDASKGADPATEKQAGRKAKTIGDLADALHREVGEAAEAQLESRSTICSTTRCCRRGGIGRSWTSRGRTCGNSSSTLPRPARRSWRTVSRRCSRRCSRSRSIAICVHRESGGTDSAAGPGARARSRAHRGRTADALAGVRGARRRRWPPSTSCGC